ncbi:MAG: glycosyltransferase [Candidatus Eremiobacteraeota bacterium]|nr:glycosyltransferase [Candidatus Eremiobacteraeota bacterium]
MKVSVQICSRNREDLLKRSLVALFKQNFPKDQYEIIVVDDGSEDGTSDMVRSLSGPCSLRLITQGHDGLSIGRNRGIKSAVGDYVLFIDDDIIADENLIAEHMRFHRIHPRSVVKGWVNHTSELDRKVPQFTIADFCTAFFWTSNVSIARKYLLEVGLFDEDFREYGWEDLELGLRLRNYGLVSRYNKKAIVFHYKSKWKKSDIPRLIEQTKAKGRTALIFLAKHPGMRVRFATSLYGSRLLMNDLFNWQDKGIDFCERVISEQDDGKELTGFALMCARNLVSFYYFNEIKKSLTPGG